jgi:transposase
MWTDENRGRYDRKGLRYPSDLTDAEWEIIAPLIPAAKRGGNKRTVVVREVVKGMVQNEVRLQLHALAYNLGVFIQGTDLPEEVADWSLTSLQTRLIKIGARVHNTLPLRCI